MSPADRACLLCSYDHLNSPGVLGSPAPAAPADPCSRETVLSVLKESRKREVEEDDERSFVGGQKSKRRCGFHSQRVKLLEED